MTGGWDGAPSRGGLETSQAELTGGDCEYQGALGAGINAEDSAWGPRAQLSPPSSTAIAVPLAQRPSKEEVRSVNPLTLCHLPGAMALPAQPPP